MKAERGRDLVASFEGVLRIWQAALAPLPTGVLFFLFRGARRGHGLGARAYRFVLLRNLAAECGDLVDVREDVFLGGVRNLHLGSRISIHPFSYLDATGGLIIGDDVSIAHGVSILSTEHNFDSLEAPIRDQGVRELPVTVESDVWIGAGARIMAGVTVGRGSVVAAGAVVTRDVEPFGVVAGVPARTIRSRGASE